MLVLSCLCYGQHVSSLNYLSGSLQYNSLNPAQISSEKVRVSIPTVLFNFGNSGFTYNQLIRKRPQDDSLFLDMNNVIKKLKTNNYLFANLHINYLSASYRYNQHQFGFSLSDKINTSIKYPKTLVELFWNGNSQFLNQKVSFGPYVSATKYREFAFRYGFKFNKLQIGAALKYLVGHSNIETTKHELTLFTDTQRYETTLTSDYLINSSNSKTFAKFPKIKNGNGINNGFALDVGAIYAVNDQITISASVLDLGFINWKSDVSNKTSNGTFTFKGVDLLTISTSDSVSFESYADSIKSTFEFKETNHQYRSHLVCKTNVSLLYKFNENNEVGAVIYGEFVDGFKPTFMVGYTRLFKDFISTGIDWKCGVNYSYKNRSFYNIGFHNSIGYKRFQLVVSGDNLMAIFLPKAVIPLKELHPVYPNENSTANLLVPKNMKNFNLLFGLNYRI